MSDEDLDREPAEGADADAADPALAKLRATILAEGAEIPGDLRGELDRELVAALEAARAAPMEMLFVAAASNRPRPLRLHVCARDGSADKMYSREWVEWAVEAGGTPYVVYRYKTGEDYAVPWNRSISLPDHLMANFSPALAIALFGGDG